MKYNFKSGAGFTLVTGFTRVAFHGQTEDFHVNQLCFTMASPHSSLLLAVKVVSAAAAQQDSEHSLKLAIVGFCSS